METVEIIKYSLSAICLIIGSFFVLTGSIGLWRMPDFFSRLHPVGVSDTAGMMFIFTGIALYFPIGLLTLKIIAILFFALITSATSCHALAKAALFRGLKPYSAESSNEGPEDDR